MNGWIEGLAGLRTAGAGGGQVGGGLIGGVLVTVLEADGSTPRESGTKMLVTGERLHGTVGGGNLEYRATAIAREMLAADGPRGAPRVERFSLGPSLGQCCGGSASLMFESVAGERDAPWIEALAAAHGAARPAVLVTTMSDGGKLLVTPEEVYGVHGTGAAKETADETASEAATRARALLAAGETLPTTENSKSSGRMLFEPILPFDFQIVLFGAGHVGQALVNVLAGLPCRVTWIDSREGQIPETLPVNVMGVPSDAPEYEVDEAPAGAWFLVMTHSHGLDFRIGERILRRGDFRYFGLIGSASKRGKFVQNLRRKGMGEDAIARLTCPIGATGIPGKRPGEIAVAVAAELLQLRAREEAGEPDAEAARAGGN